MEKNNQQTIWIYNLKFLAISIIVLGHCGFDLKKFFWPNSLEALGVGPFFLLLGYNLAKSTKADWELIYTRLFKIYAVGIFAAISHSMITYFITGNIVKSNFLPFMFGVNSFFINASVPGNPVLWFVGAYTHFVIMYTILRKRIKINITYLFFIFLFEIFVKYWNGVFYDSYTLFLGWITIFYTGIYIKNGEKIILNIIENYKLHIYFYICIIGPLILILTNTWPNVINQSLRFWIITMIFFIIAVNIPSKKVFIIVARNTLFIFLFHHIIVHFMPWGVPFYIIILEAVVLIMLFSFVPEYLRVNKFLTFLENYFFSGFMSVLTNKFKS